MSSFNQVILMGNLTRDVDVKYTPGGTMVAQIGIAMNRKWRDPKTNELKDEATFQDVVLFGKSAELAQQYLARGRLVHIQGRLRTDRWTDKQSGQQRQRNIVICERMTFLPSGALCQAGTAATTADAQRAAQPAQKPAEPGEFEDLNIPEENVPF